MTVPSQLEWRRQCALLRALLFDAERRNACHIGEGLLRFTDAQQLTRTAERIATSVWTNRRRGAAAVKEMYRRTLSATEARQHTALMKRFCASDWFRRFGERTDRDQQLSVEEAFYRFLCSEDIGVNDVRHLEFIDAMMRALVVQQRPAFQIPDELQSAPFGYFALAADGAQDYLFAIVDTRMVHGPIDTVTAEIVRHRAIRPSVSPVTANAWDAARAQLADIGMVF